MNKIIGYKTRLLNFSILALFSFNYLSAATLTKNVGPTSFDRRTGKWYLGASATSASSQQAVASVGPATADGTVTITSLISSSDTDVLGKAIGVLTTTPTSTNTSTIVIGTDAAANTKFFSFVDTGSGTYDPSLSTAWLDASGDTTAGLVAVAARPKKANAPSTALGHVFAAVGGNGGNFGVTADGGIGIGSLTDAGVITQKDATGAVSTGDLQIITGDSDAVDGLGFAGAATLSVDTAVLRWSEDLKRLFVGLKGNSKTSATGVMISLSTWSVSDLDGVADADYTLTTTPLLINAQTWGDPATATTNYIVGANGDGTYASYVGIYDMQVMHTSSDRYYLIVQGGANQIDTDLATSITTLARNEVYALPLVGPEGDAPGCLAAVLNRGNLIATGNDLIDDPVVVNFSTKAASVSEILRKADTAALVGGMNLPITSTAQVNCQGIQVVGDTVYATCARGSTAVGATVEPGVYYSTALINENGAIQGWTEWEKAAPNISSGPGTDDSADGSCYRSAVDASRGKIFMIQDGDKKTITQTYWQKDTVAATTYGGQINAILSGPCYSSFILHSRLKQLGDVNMTGNEKRYAVFGGKGKIAAIKYAESASNSFVAIETPSSNWDLAANAAEDCSNNLPANGKVTALGWTHKNSGATDNYILAGIEDDTNASNTGLWALAITDASTATNRLGFNTAAAGLDMDSTHIFDSATYSWYQLTNVTGRVMKIISNPNQVAIILTRENGAASGTGRHKLYILNGDNANMSTLNSALAATKILTTGESGGDLENVTTIHDMAWVANVQDAGDYSEDFYQLLLSTDDGLYVSTEVGGNDSATTAASINLKKIDNGQYGNLQSAFNTRTPITIQMTEDVYNSAGQRKSELKQICCSNRFDIQKFMPYNFTSNDRTPDMVTHAPKAKSLFIDGGFRFLLADHHDRQQRNLHVVPFEAKANEYGVSDSVEVPDTALNSKNIHWIGRIGAGYLAAGTDEGLIVLR